MPHQIIAGRVNLNGSIAGGEGFYVRALGGGTYLVEFATPMAAMPSVVIKQNYKNWDDFSYAGGDTRDSAVLVAVDQKGFKVVTGQSDGSKLDRNFAFIASVYSSSQDVIPPLISGNVSANGTNAGGSGFEPTPIGNGVYMVHFDHALEKLASVVVTEDFPYWNDFNYDEGDTLGNAVIVAASETEFKYITGDPKGNKTSCNCGFVAVGRGVASPPYPRLIVGNVNANGTIQSDSGDFTVTKDGTGTYMIRFNPAFTRFPTMLLTQNYKNWGDFEYGGGDTRDNAVLVAINQAQAKVITVEDNGNKSDRNFCFFAIG